MGARKRRSEGKVKSERETKHYTAVALMCSLTLVKVEEMISSHFCSVHREPQHHSTVIGLSCGQEQCYFFFCLLYLLLHLHHYTGKSAVGCHLTGMSPDWTVSHPYPVPREQYLLLFICSFIVVPLLPQEIFFALL